MSDESIADSVYESVRSKQAFQIARTIEDLVVDANALDDRREIDIAIEHLETAAMWFNRAHYAAKKGR